MKRFITLTIVAILGFTGIAQADGLQSAATGYQLTVTANADGTTTYHRAYDNGMDATIVLMGAPKLADGWYPVGSAAGHSHASTFTQTVSHNNGNATVRRDYNNGSTAMIVKPTVETPAAPTTTPPTETASKGQSLVVANKGA